MWVKEERTAHHTTTAHSTVIKSWKNKEQHSHSAHTDRQRTPPTPTISTFNLQWPLSPIPIPPYDCHCRCPSVTPPRGSQVGSPLTSNSSNSTAELSSNLFLNLSPSHHLRPCSSKHRWHLCDSRSNWIWQRSYCKLLNPSTTSFVQRWSNDIRCGRQ